MFSRLYQRLYSYEGPPDERYGGCPFTSTMISLIHSYWSRSCHVCEVMNKERRQLIGPPNAGKAPGYCVTTMPHLNMLHANLCVGPSLKPLHDTWNNDFGPRVPNVEAVLRRLWPHGYLNWYEALSVIPKCLACSKRDPNALSRHRLVWLEFLPHWGVVTIRSSTRDSAPDCTDSTIRPFKAGYAVGTG